MSPAPSPSVSGPPVQERRELKMSLRDVSDAMHFENMEPNVLDVDETPSNIQKRPSVVIGLALKPLSKFASPEGRQTRFQLWYLLAVADIIISSIWIGKSPSTFYKFWLFNIAGMLLQRLFVFYRRRMLLFLLSFCYFINAYAIFHVLHAMQSITFAKLTFVVGMGPMVGTSLLVGNALVLHSWNHISLIYVHWGLGLMAFTLRWYPPTALAAAAAVSPAEWNAITIQEFLNPTYLYIVWAVGYSLLLFVLLRPLISKYQYESQYSKTVNGGMGVISKMINLAPPKWHRVGFFLAQYTIYFGSMLYTPFLWKSFYCSATYLTCSLMLIAWRGSKVHVVLKEKNT